MKVWTIEVCNDEGYLEGYRVVMVLESQEEAERRLPEYKKKYDYVLVDSYEFGEKIP